MLKFNRRKASAKNAEATGHMNGFDMGVGQRSSRPVSLDGSDLDGGAAALQPINNDDESLVLGIRKSTSAVLSSYHDGQTNKKRSKPVAVLEMLRGKLRSGPKVRPSRQLNHNTADVDCSKLTDCDSAGSLSNVVNNNFSMNEGLEELSVGTNSASSHHHISSSPAEYLDTDNELNVYSEVSSESGWQNGPSHWNVTSSELEATPRLVGLEGVRSKVDTLNHNGGSMRLLQSVAGGAGSGLVLSELNNTSCAGVNYASAKCYQHSADDVSGKITNGIIECTTDISEVRPAPKWTLAKELMRLSHYGWYWGPVSREEAEEKLSDQPEGAFLVRDSTDDRYLFSLSFRSSGRTLHTRVEYCNGEFSFYAQPRSDSYHSMADLIERCVAESQSGIYCYSRGASGPGAQSYPVKLTRPVSRFSQVRSLQYLCRFVIRQHTRVDHIQNLPLPVSVKGWLKQNQY